MSEHDEVNPELGPEGGFEEDASGLEGMEDLGRIAEYSWHVPASDCQDNIAIYSALPLQAGNGDCYAVAAGGDECVRLLRVNEEQGVEVTQTLAGIHSDTIVKLVLSEDKIILAAAGMDGIVSLYRLNYDDQNTISISHLNNLEGPAREIEDVCWSPKGHVLMAGGFSSQICTSMPKFMFVLKPYIFFLKLHRMARHGFGMRLKDSLVLSVDINFDSQDVRSSHAQETTLAKLRYSV